MMDINPTDLRYFFEVSQTLNISRASERLNIGQSAVSQAIQRLEKILGVTLFDRFKTGVQLTPSGQKLLIEGRLALDVWSSLIYSTQSAQKLIQGQYTLGCHTAIAQYTLPLFLPKLLSTYPKLEINLKHGLSREITADLINFKIDFALVMNPVKHPDLIIKYLFEDKVLCWKAPHTIMDTLIFDPSLSQSQVLLKKLEKTLNIQRHLSSSSLETIALLTSKGCGIGILPTRVAQFYSNLSPISKETPWVIDKLAFIYRADRSLTAASKAIVNLITERCRENES